MLERLADNWNPILTIISTIASITIVFFEIYKYYDMMGRLKILEIDETGVTRKIARTNSARGGAQLPETNFYFNIRGENTGEYPVHIESVDLYSDHWEGGLSCEPVSKDAFSGGIFEFEAGAVREPKYRCLYDEYISDGDIVDDTIITKVVISSENNKWEREMTFNIFEEMPSY